MDNTFLAGGSLSFNLMDIFFINAGIWTIINPGTGEMNDYDWFYNNLKDWTHKSNHSIFLNQSFFYNINSSFTFLHYSNWLFSAIIGFEQNFLYWTDNANNFIYTSISQDSSYIEGISPLHDYTGSFNQEPGISYQVLYSIPYLGLGVKYTNSTFSIMSQFCYSFLAWAEDHDHHIMRDLHFLDFFENISTLSAGINIKTYISNNIYLSFTTILQYIFEIRGDVAMYADGDIENIYLFEDEAGFQNYSLLFNTSLGIEF